MKVGLVGLGLMGSAMGPNLQKAGFEVVGFDRDPDRVSEHRSRGGTVAGSVREVTDTTGIVVLSLPTSEIGRDVCLGPDGIVGSKATLVIDTTTARPADTLEIASGLAAAGIGFVDATMSGNARQAASRDIVAMVGGSAEDVALARPVLEAVARSVHHLGSVGSGARTKLIVNLVLGIHRVALAEGLVMGEQAGIDLPTLLGVLRDGAAYSKAMDVWGDRMVEGDHYPPDSRIRQNHKDFRLILEQGQEVGSPTRLAAVVEALLTDAEEQGLSDADNSAVIAALPHQTRHTGSGA